MVKKNLFFVVLFSICSAAAMDVRFEIKKNCSQEEKNTYYARLEYFLHTRDGRGMVLYPEYGEFLLPSRYTYFLHLAIALDDIRGVNTLLNLHGKMIVAGFKHGCRTLNYAVRNGNEEIIELIRTKGSNIIMFSHGNGLVLEKKLTKEQIAQYANDLSRDENDDVENCLSLEH